MLPALKEKVNPLQVKIFEVGIDFINFDNCVDKICEFIKGPHPHMVITANSLMLNFVDGSQELKHAFRRAGLVIADGIGVVLAVKFLYNIALTRIAGIDLMYALCDVAAQKSYSIYILGSREEVNKHSVLNLKKKFPHLKIKGRHHGYFSSFEEDKILDEIRRLSPNIVFVGLDVPRQERWISMNIDRMGKCVCMGIGGSLDVISGRLSRAPFWMRRWGLEWIHRFILQPWRIKRLLGLPIFMWKVIREKFTIKNNQ